MESRPRAPQRQSTHLAFHASRIVIDIGVLLVLGSMSLTFVTAEAGDRSAIAADALPALLLVLPVFAMTMIPDHSRPLPAPLGWLSLILAVAALPYAVVKYLDASTVAQTLDGEVAMGARLLVFGTLVVVAGIVIGLARSVLRLPSAGMSPDPRQAPARRIRPRPPASGTGGSRFRTQATPQVSAEGAPSGSPPSAGSQPGTGEAPPPERSQTPPRRSSPPKTGGDEPPRPDPPATRPAPAREADSPPRVSPPRARRPDLTPRPEHDALPFPEHPTGELPLPRRPSERDDV